MLIDMALVEQELKAMAEEFGYPADWWLTLFAQRLGQRLEAENNVLDFQLKEPPHATHCKDDCHYVDE